jgi:hypothetical protein
MNYRIRREKKRGRKMERNGRERETHVDSMQSREIV